ncbi:MAG: hypothetical protein CAPSK01_003509 [Candidatus Accumulibacter vicinus]|uniref:Uncharacterized protein n=1 Tax=Candidatus Accumulibacter vicinus TaxID=2954382 RepID=A0A084XXF2_9PROT|nr:MAG: hypothetical protein CAPSK01_003509 [Candidatus Accumulibacter vicinus]
MGDWTGNERGQVAASADAATGLTAPAHSAIPQRTMEPGKKWKKVDRLMVMGCK